MSRHVMPTSAAYARRSCPGCGAETPTTQRVRSLPAAEDTEFDEVLRQWDTDLRQRKSFFTYLRCARCGLAYCPVYPDDVQLRRLYGSMKPNLSALPETCLRRTQEGYLRTLLRHRPPPGDVIEIGPDRGFLANAVKRSPGNTAGMFRFIEPNVAVHADLRASVEPSPCDISADLDSFDHIPDDSAGFAVMIHVLDHLLDPVGHLRRIRRCLVPGGLVGIVVHDERSLSARWLGSRHPIYCPYHPQLFNPRTLSATLRAAGFEVLEVVKTRNHYPLRYVAETALSRFGLGAIPLPIPQRLVLPLALGNIQATARRG